MNCGGQRAGAQKAGGQSGDEMAGNKSYDLVLQGQYRILPNSCKAKAIRQRQLQKQRRGSERLRRRHLFRTYLTVSINASRGVRSGGSPLFFRGHICAAFKGEGLGGLSAKVAPGQPRKFSKGLAGTSIVRICVPFRWHNAMQAKLRICWDPLQTRKDT